MVLRMGTGSMLYGGGSFVRYAAVRTHCPPGATAIAINTCMLGLSPKTPHTAPTKTDTGAAEDYGDGNGTEWNGDGGDEGGH